MSTLTRPSGQATLASLRLCNAGTNMWQQLATTSTLVTKVDGTPVVTVAAADGSQTCTGGLSLAKGLSVGGNASVTGTLGVTGTSAFSGGVTVAAPLTQSGAGNAVSLAGPLSLSGSLTQTGTGAVNLAGAVTATAAVQLSGTLTQTGSGAVSFAGPTVHTNTLAVSGNYATTLGGTLTCNGSSMYLNGTNPGLLVQGAGGSGSTSSVVLASYTSGTSPVPFQLSVQDDGNSGNNFLVQQKPSGAMANALATRLFLQASTGFLGLNTSAPGVQLDVAGAGQFTQVAAGKQVAVRNTSTSNDANGAEVYFDRTAAASTQYASVGISGTTRNFYVNVGGGTDEINIAPQGPIACNQPLKLANSASFTGNYPELANRPLATFYNAGTITFSAKIWTATATTTAGAATFYPTSTNASGGTALFTTILSVQSCAVVNTILANAVAYCGVRSASTTSIVINAITTSGVGNAPAAAANGTSVYCLVVGV